MIASLFPEKILVCDTGINNVWNLYKNYSKHNRHGKLYQYKFKICIKKYMICLKNIYFTKIVLTYTVKMKIY